MIGNAVNILCEDFDTHHVAYTRKDRIIHFVNAKHITIEPDNHNIFFTHPATGRITISPSSCLFMRYNGECLLFYLAPDIDYNDINQVKNYQGMPFLAFPLKAALDGLL